MITCPFTGHMHEIIPSDAQSQGASTDLSLGKKQARLRDRTSNLFPIGKGTLFIMQIKKQRMGWWKRLPNFKIWKKSELFWKQNILTDWSRQSTSNYVSSTQKNSTFTLSFMAIPNNVSSAYRAWTWNFWSGLCDTFLARKVTFSSCNFPLMQTRSQVPGGSNDRSVWAENHEPRQGTCFLFFKKHLYHSVGTRGRGCELCSLCHKGAETASKPLLWGCLFFLV